MRLPEAPGLPLPTLCFVGSSGSGKTTLLTRLLPRLRAAGLRVAVVKHAHHGFDLDRPGKDSYRVREAGAAQVLVASRRRWVLMTELDGTDEPTLAELLARLDPAAIDLVLAEGFAGEACPKIEVYRAAHGEPPKCWPADPAVVAVASDVPVVVDEPGVRLDLNDPDEVCRFVLSHLAPRAASMSIHVA